MPSRQELLDLPAKRRSEFADTLAVFILNDYIIPAALKEERCASISLSAVLQTIDNRMDFHRYRTGARFMSISSKDVAAALTKILQDCAVNIDGDLINIVWA